MYSWQWRLAVSGQCVCKLLKNKEEGRTGDDILQKDPQEMRAMMQDRLSHVKA